MENSADTTAEPLPDDAAGPPPPKGWRRAALAVPSLVVLAWVLFGVYVPLDNSHTHHESRSCRSTPLPWTEWAVAYGGLVATLAAVLLQLVLARHGRRRGWDRTASWEGRLAFGFAVLGWLTTAVLAGVVAVTHVEAGSHDGPICEGLGATHGTQVTRGHIPGVPGRFG